MVKHLKVGPYTFKVVPLYAGPLLEVSGDYSAVAQLVNHAVDPSMSDLAKAIRDAREGSNPVVQVTPAAEDPAGPALLEDWASRTGERLDADKLAAVRTLTDVVPVSWAALQKGLMDLNELRADWQPEPGPWLFVKPARSPFVTPEDFDLVQSLEKELLTIDEINLQSEVGREPQALIVRRQKFLIDCGDAGIFASEHGSIIEQWLSNWSAVRLLALRRAAVQLLTWGFLKEDEPSDRPVCLDYVRLQLWPPDEDGQDWASAAMKLLPAASEDDQGAVLERVGSATITVWWRRDGERPALLAIANR